MKTLYLTDGTVYHNPVIQIWEDLHTEKSGYFRAFWCENKDSKLGCPVIGYCSAGGSHRTVSATFSEAKRLYPEAKFYRNGREIKY